MAEVKTNTQNQQQQKKADTKLILQKNAFPKLIETAFADTQEFAKMINSVFAPAFKPQYYGAHIQPFGSRIETTIFFIDRGASDDEFDSENGPYKAIEPKGKKSDSALGKFKAYNQFHSSVGGYKPKYYELTEECKSILSEFVPRNAFDSKGNVKWDKGDLVIEKVDNDNYGRPRVLIGVKIDFVRLIKKVYGSEYDYGIIVGNPTNQQTQMMQQFYPGAPVNNVNGSWQLFVLRAAREDIKNLAAKYGYNSYNKYGIVTD